MSVPPKAQSFLQNSAVLILVCLLLTAGCTPSTMNAERQITHAPHGHVLTNVNVWSPDGQRIAYDIRSDADGSVFDGSRIETVDVDTGAAKTLYTSRNGAHCGVVTYHPRLNRVVFILGPEHPTPEWNYGVSRRQGVLVDEETPGVATPLDARDLTPLFTPGALRGGSHVHVFSPDGSRVSFTYDDQVLARFTSGSESNDEARRNVGVSVVDTPVTVAKDHERNHDGSAFSVLVTRTNGWLPTEGSDDYVRAYEEGWVGREGYLRPDGSRQHYALAFLADVQSERGRVAEVFIADLPDDLTKPSERGPLAGTQTRMPWPPAGVSVRRLTHTPAASPMTSPLPRHWLRSSPDGSQIAFLRRDRAGVVQLWTISPNGGEPRQITRNALGVTSAFTWSPDGKSIAFVMDDSVCVADAVTGTTTRLTLRSTDDDAPLPLACVFSPAGDRIAYLRRVVHPADGKRYNQIFVVDAEASATRPVRR